MTEKLYEIDSHIKAFSAVVQACCEMGDKYKVVLDRTAFFPEGGGQCADTGVLNQVRVLDVQEQGGVIYHITDAPFSVGAKVDGLIDWEERFSKMQHHSGEHIVSGIVHSIYGYDNVGFHMGTDAVTMDFNGLLNKEQVKEIERKANEVVVKNIAIEVSYPTDEELKTISYRSKIEIENQVRIVTIPGYDVCACCAPHVKQTGEIGLIKLVGVQNYKGGVRISMLCGFRAIADYEKKADSVKSISVLLSVKEIEVADEVAKLKEQLAEQKNQILDLQDQLLTWKAEGIENNQEVVVMFETDLEGNGPRELTNLLLAKEIGVAAVFAGNDMDGYRYVIGSKTMDVRELARKLNERFDGKGGGKPEMVQGSLLGMESDVRKVVLTCVEKA